MADDESSLTSATLLGKIRESPSDRMAWDLFVARYGPKILGWCRQRGLQQADAEDVTQDVLLRLSRTLRAFSYDPSRSFRGWLRTVTRNALNDFLTDRARTCVGTGGDRVLGLLQSVEAREDLMTRLESEFDREVVEVACNRVRARIEPATWEAFLLTASQSLAGDEVAARLGMSVAAVFKAKSRVLVYIREEISRLDSGA